MNRNGQIIRIIPARTKEIRKTKNRSSSDILGKSASYRDFERFRSRDVVESPFPVHGATRKMEGRGGEGRDRLLVPLSGKCDLSYRLDSRFKGM